MKELHVVTYNINDREKKLMVEGNGTLVNDETLEISVGNFDKNSDILNKLTNTQKDVLSNAYANRYTREAQRIRKVKNAEYGERQ